LQLEDHIDENIRKHSGVITAGVVGLCCDQGGWTKHHLHAQLVAAKRDHDRDVLDYISLPDILRDSRFSRELSP